MEFTPQNSCRPGRLSLQTNLIEFPPRSSSRRNRAILGLATRSAVITFHSRSANAYDAIFIRVQIAVVIFLACARSNVPLHVWPVAVPIMAENSMRVFGYG